MIQVLTNDTIHFNLCARYLPLPLSSTLTSNLISLSPLPQRRHIPALPDLPVPKHLPVLRIQQLVIRVAEDILAQGVKAVQHMR